MQIPDRWNLGLGFLFAQNYFPYLEFMPRFSSVTSANFLGKYFRIRYGLNGQEKDGEIAEGIYTADYWEYDSKLGRRWNVDPVVKPNESPYATFANNPIWFIDVTGADTGDVVICFGGADINNEGDAGGAKAIADEVYQQECKTDGGACGSANSTYWGTAPDDPASLDQATQAAYDYVTNNYNKDANGDPVEGGKVVIYGYSYGGVMATHLAERLAADGIQVDLLVTVDAAAGPESDEVDRSPSPNVKYNMNFYQTTPSVVLSHGAPNVAEDPSKTTVLNKDITCDAVSHGNIDDLTQDAVINLIVNTLNL